MSRAKMQRGPMLRFYLLISPLFALIAGPILRKRLARGKEHPTRWLEKRAENLAARQEGPLIWINAVGLGEILSLRGLITRLGQHEPEASFLVTSTTIASSQVFAKNLPPRTTHQFLPIDAPAYRRRFLDHFRPDLCIWAEQDLWPGFVSELDNRDIPQAMVAARMNDRSFRSHQRAKGLYRNLYQAMALVTAQDAATANHLALLGAEASVTGSLKPAAPALDDNADERDVLSQTLKDRFVWAVAPSHAEDEKIALDAHRIILQTDPAALLIIAPRFPERRDEIAQKCNHAPPRKSRGDLPRDADSIWLCDTFGDLGLIYRQSKAVLTGGTFGATQGHNPWEAAALNTAIFHGPNTANFSNDFELLDQAGATSQVDTAETLAYDLMCKDLAQIAQNAAACIKSASAQTDALAADLIALLNT